MGGACSAIGGAISNAFSGRKDTTRDQGAPRGSTMNAPANTVTDTVLMDLGLKEKNDVYDRDLKARQMASAAALKEFTAQQKRNDKDSRPAATVTATDTATTTDTAADTTTTLDTATDTDLTEVETISETTFGGGDFTGNAGSGASVGAAEDEAIDLMKKGRRSTILTTPGGLLGDGEEDGKKTRRRRSLIG